MTTKVHFSNKYLITIMDEFDNYWNYKLGKVRSEPAASPTSQLYISCSRLVHWLYC